MLSGINKLQIDHSLIIPASLWQFLCITDLHLDVINRLPVILYIYIQPDTMSIHICMDTLLQFRIFNMVNLQIRKNPLQ